MDCREGTTHAQRANKIRELNDRLRKTGVGGKTVLTRAVAALGAAELAELLRQVRDFDDFTPDNDPWQEHDFGQITLNDERYFWKIDAYDVNLEFGSPDPADEAATCRVITIMTAMDL